MSENTARTRTSKLNRLEIAVSILNFAVAILNAIRFWHRHDSLDAVNAGLFLVLAALFMSRSRRIGEKANC
jgi:uncharacterized membrane protein